VAQAIRDRLLQKLEIPEDTVVSGYWPIGDELDVRPLLSELFARGNPICLPEVVGRGKPLIFRKWSPGDPLRNASFGTQVPLPDSPERVPRVLLVPLLAFDRTGYRLGYGGGFYDRTLSQLREHGSVVAIGIAGAVQEVAEVPHDASDQRLDWIATEREVFEIN
jgi:5-formyltetrahydrofolate cyclo-ligase